MNAGNKVSNAKAWFLDLGISWIYKGFKDVFTTKVMFDAHSILTKKKGTTQSQKKYNLLRFFFKIISNKIMLATYLKKPTKPI